MSNFGKILKEKDDFYPDGFSIQKETEYYSKFLNPYIKIPKSISSKVENLYGSQKKKVRHCIKLIITNLIAQGVIAYSKRTNFYTKQHTRYYTYAAVSRAVDILEGEKYLKVKRGSRDITFSKGISSRLYPREKITKVFDLERLDVEIDLKALPLFEIDKKPIYSKKDLKSVNARYASINHTNESSHTSLMVCSSEQTNTTTNKLAYSSPYDTFYTQSEVLNREYFNKMVLDMGTLSFSKKYLTGVGLTRIFSSDDECGRWYQKGGYSYQQLSEDERRRILLNGYEVVELDYSAMHPHILYAWEGTQCPHNFYEMIATALCLGYDDYTKFIVKRVSLMSINADSPKTLSRAINKDKKDELHANETREKEGRQQRPILYDEMTRFHLDYIKIVAAFQNIHPKISKYIYSNSANRLMLEESKILTTVLFELKQNGIPALPLHDSVIVPIQHKDITEKTMVDCYKKHMGFDILVK
jgi:hypothetical protein